MLKTTVEFLKTDGGLHYLGMPQGFKLKSFESSSGSKDKIDLGNIKNTIFHIMKIEVLSKSCQ